MHKHFTQPKQVILDLISDGDRKSTLRRSLTIDQATTLAARKSKLEEKTLKQVRNV